MIQEWNIDGKKGHVLFPEGEVVYQQPKGSIVNEAIYQAEDGTRYVLESPVGIKDDNERKVVMLCGKEVITESSCDKLACVTTNPFNGYCYRQDGK